MRISPRSLSTLKSCLENAQLCTVLSKNDSLLCKIRSGSEISELKIPLVWMRDHCRSRKSYNHSTNQRLSSMRNLWKESQLKEFTIDSSQQTITLWWSDGHVSKYKLSEILESEKSHSELVLWDREALLEIPTFASKNLNFGEFARSFYKFGVAIINGVAANAKDTERLCRSIAPIHDTYFGAFWVFSNESKKEQGEEYHEDTAYGQDAIGPHTDGTYFDQTPGIQVFHCLRPAEKGGDTVLVDGWKCAEKIRTMSPRAFSLLSSRKVEHHYIEKGNGSELHAVCYNKPVIEVDDFGNIVQLRFNPYDRAPMKWLRANDGSKSAKEIIEFYLAYIEFVNICNDPSNSVQVSLSPGSVIFIDNFRVLHSRTAFEGYRQMSGCYLSRDNFMAKTRPFLK